MHSDSSCMYPETDLISIHVLWHFIYVFFFTCIFVVGSANSSEEEDLPCQEDLLNTPNLMNKKSPAFEALNICQNRKSLVRFRILHKSSTKVVINIFF